MKISLKVKERNKKRGPEPLFLLSYFRLFQNNDFFVNLELAACLDKVDTTGHG